MLKGDQIPLQSRIIAILARFDELARSDIAGKRAVPMERALSILKQDARDNKLDAALVDVFANGKAYARIDGYCES